MAKQLVGIVITGADGTGEKEIACAVRGGLVGKVNRVQYITDGVREFGEGATVELTAANGGEILKATLAGRQIWEIDGPVLQNEAIKCVVANGGKGKAGSFVVTCS